MPTPRSSNPTSAPEMADRVVQQAFARLNGRAWGIAFALLAGLGILIPTWVLVLEGGARVGPHLALLAVFFPGYSVTFGGGLIGFVYGFVVGYALGRLIGIIYDLLLPSPYAG
ncbi:MAG: hypothetical protein M3Z05_04225 [Gemmatimonadota bacterium]|nr:hypothetical protein [Gemmatimonadota bacterium]